MVWTLVEPGVAITAASLITIRPLLRALNISGFSSGSTRNTSHHMGSTALSQTLQNRSQNISTNRSQMQGGGDFALKSWNEISAGGGAGKKGGITGGKGEIGTGLMRTETTAVSETGSEEYILRREREANDEIRGDDRHGSSDGNGVHRDGIGITRTVVVRIQSAPNVIEMGNGGIMKTGGSRDSDRKNDRDRNRSRDRRRGG
jgi:hypothetical protein